MYYLSPLRVINNSASTCRSIKALEEQNLVKPFIPQNILLSHRNVLEDRVQTTRLIPPPAVLQTSSLPLKMNQF